MSKDKLNINTLDDRTVYVCAVNVDDLPEAVAKGISQDQVYSLNSSKGERLALVEDRSLAFVLARQNEFHPVPVH
jgi:hypothetical protein